MGYGFLLWVLVLLVLGRCLNVDSLGLESWVKFGDENVVGNILKGFYGVCEIIF